MLISAIEVQEARQRLIAKYGQAYGLRRGWLPPEEAEKLKVKLKVTRKEGVLGQFCQLWQGNVLVVESYIFPTPRGEFKNVREIIEATKKEWEIVNLPTENDPRYYVRLLAVYQSIGTMSMGCVVEGGKSVDCYTVDDLIAVGFAD